MDLVEKKEYFNELFDCYGCLLTEKQQTYFKEYCFEDMSLAEIACFYKVSRNAVYDQLNKTYNLLEKYESKLKILFKQKERMSLVEDYLTKKITEKEFITKITELEYL